MELVAPVCGRVTVRGVIFADECCVGCYFSGVLEFGVFGFLDFLLLLGKLGVGVR